MNEYVRQTLLWRMELLDQEIAHMAEDILEARAHLKAAEIQVELMTAEYSAIAAHLKNPS